MPDANDAVHPLPRTRERARVRARELRQTSPDAERYLWQALRDRQLGGCKFRRQRPVGKYFADFACVEAKLIVEVDGGQHFSQGGVTADIRRTAELNQLGYHLLRFSDREVLMERESVLVCIFNWLAANHPHPHPQAGEGVLGAPLPQAGEGLRCASPASVVNERTQ